MTTTPQSTYQAFVSGYEDGSGACLVGGSEAGWEMVREQRHRGTGYTVGLRQAIWDWEDSNGMPHGSPQKQAARSTAG